MPLAANKQIKFSTLTSPITKKTKKFSHPEKEIKVYKIGKGVMYLKHTLCWRMIKLLSDHHGRGSW